MGITSGTVSIMRSFLAFACLLTVTFGAPSGNNRALRRTIKEGELYEKIKDILFLERILIDFSQNDDLSSDVAGIPKKDNMRSQAIYKYTTGLIPGASVSDPIFKTFYPKLANWPGRGAIILPLPNTKKTIQQLQLLFNHLLKELTGPVTNNGETLYGKTESFRTELENANIRQKFLDDLKKDVILLYAAYLQSFLIEQERMENDKDDKTTLYRLTPLKRFENEFLRKKITDKDVEGQMFCTDSFTSTSRPESGKTFLEHDETRGPQKMDDVDWEEVNEIKMTITKPFLTACGVHLPKEGDYASGFWSYQREVLLPIGTCFKIKEIRENKNKKDPFTKYDIKMECVPNVKL